MILLLACLLFTETVEGHWIQLHDGETQFGWVTTSDANWQVKEGVISVSRGEPGFLRTTSPFADFELQLDYRSAPETNSGVFIRMNENPQDPARDCYEINLAHPHPFPTGSIVARAQATGQPPAADDAWHRMRIRAVGGQIEVWIDDAMMVSWEDAQPIKHGYIGLQFNKGEVEFKQLRLRPLNLRPLIAESLEGWSSLPDQDGQFEVVASNTIKVTGGPGQLETEEAFGDFLLQTECRTHARGLNSGIFFRCIPGDRMMGYESQIDNTMTNDDPGQPANCGTGGIFRRVDARRIMANDLEWFKKTIVVHGPHIAVWVNGYQVTDWTDTREPNPNPRRGLRVEPGTIMLQAHDPTTDVDFRQLNIVEYESAETPQ